MSPVNQFTVLAFAAGALAVPGYRDYAGKHGHHGHHRFHQSAGASGSGAPFPYGNANSTGLWGTTGTGYATGSAAPSVYSSESSSGPVIVTVSPVPASYTASASSEAAPTSIDTNYNAASSTDCTTDVTVTTTEKTYITITATEDVTSSEAVAPTEVSSSSRSVSTVHVQSTVYYTPSSSSEAVSSSAAPVESSSSAPAPETTSSEVSVAATAPAAYTPSTSSSAAESSSSSSAYVAPVSYSEVQKAPSYSAPAYSAPASSSSAVAPSSYVAPSSTSSSAAAASSTAASSGSGGKRGLAYNDYQLTECYMDSPHMGFAYNWGSNAGGYDKGDTSINYIPLLWGTDAQFTDAWSQNAGDAIKNGSEYLFGFNEPDLGTQSNLSPEAAAAAWKTYMEPFAGQAKLCTPAVTNGGGDYMGLSWLSNFLNACSGCTIDCASVHWYDSFENTEYFKDHITNATEIANGLPIFVTEFGTTDGDAKDISGFLQDVMPWMDSNDGIAGYAYFMVQDGLLNSGSEPSEYGSVYSTYSS